MNKHRGAEIMDVFAAYVEGLDPPLRSKSDAHFNEESQRFFLHKSFILKN